MVATNTIASTFGCDNVTSKPIFKGLCISNSLAVCLAVPGIKKFWYDS